MNTDYPFCYPIALSYRDAGLDLFSALAHKVPKAYCAIALSWDTVCAMNGTVRHLARVAALCLLLGIVDKHSITATTCLCPHGLGLPVKVLEVVAAWCPGAAYAGTSSLL